MHNVVLLLLTIIISDAIDKVQYYGLQCCLREGQTGVLAAVSTRELGVKPTVK